MSRARAAGRGQGRVACALATGLLMVGLVGAYAGAAPALAATHPSITLYNGQHEQTAADLIGAFEKKTGITVHVRSDDEDVLADQIITEGKRSPADVIYTENSLPLEHLQDKGLLAPVASSSLKHTPSRYNSPTGDWIGVSARVSVIVYNPSLIKKSQLPTSVRQMADPRYRGKIALAPGETDFQPIITAYVRRYGKAAAVKWLTGLKANAETHVYPDNETIADEVNRGAVAFGVVNQYYWYRMRAEVGAVNMHSKITYFTPHDPGYVIDISGAAILKSSQHKAAAQKFLAFLVSRQGQEIIGAHSISFEYPIASGVTTAAPETPFAKLAPYPITVAELGDGVQAIALLREVGLL